MVDAVTTPSTIATESAATGGYSLPAAAAAMTVPIALFSVMGYDINPAFFLAPFIPFAYLANVKGQVSLLFAASVALGLASILIANAIEPDGRFARNVLSFILFLFPASVFFLGRYLVHDIKKAVFWLALFSAIFVIPVAARLILIDQAARLRGTPSSMSVSSGFLCLPPLASTLWLICFACRRPSCAELSLRQTPRGRFAFSFSLRPSRHSSLSSAAMQEAPCST